MRTEVSEAVPVGVMRSGFLPGRIIHLHPSRLCNLSCAHCYSTSDPRQHSSLPVEVLLPALGVLRAEGYEQVSLSGGEPLAYRSIHELVSGCKRLGYRVTMVTNGLLATQRMDATLALLDGIAISFDGLEATHDSIRGKQGAFRKAMQALERLAKLGLPVSAAVSLVRDAVCELPDLADLLRTTGAHGLQVRPVALAGRAREHADAMACTSVDLMRLYLIVLALNEETPSSFRVHCDLAPTQGLWQQNEAYAGLLGSCDFMPRSERPLADLVNPLVITDEGTMKPIAYDFHPRFDIGPVVGPLNDILRRYKTSGLADFQQLIGRTLRACGERSELVDWFDLCTRSSADQVGMEATPPAAVGG